MKLLITPVSNALYSKANTKIFFCDISCSEAVYSIVSNAGEIALLVGVTVLVFLVQEDFRIAGFYADFLRSSNVAFLSSVPISAEPGLAIRDDNPEPV